MTTSEVFVGMFKDFVRFFKKWPLKGILFTTLSIGGICLILDPFKFPRYPVILLIISGILIAIFGGVGLLLVMFRKK